jgi:ornithine cyclodeaminase
MPDITILTERELRDCVTLDKSAADVVEAAFKALAEGGVIMPPILGMTIEAKNGEVDVKTAYIPGLDGFAIKVSPGFFDNPRKGLPSLNGLMVLLCAETGIVKSVLLDNGYLTDLRTAAAGAVAARHLAPEQVRTAGVIGAGMQARLQMQALRLERAFDELLVWSPRTESSRLYAEEQAEILGVPVKVADSAEQVVRLSQIVVTTTPARKPVVLADWLHPGLHITAMGSDSPEKNELDPHILARADRFVCDRIQQSQERGELRAALETGVAGIELTEIGEICAGQKPGRRSADEITVCDLTGTGAQDTAIATHAAAIARTRGYGTLISA